MTWWTTATLTDGLVDEVVAVVFFVAAFVAAVIVVGLFVEMWREAERRGGPVGGMLPFVLMIAIAVLSFGAGSMAWPRGHPVGVVFVAVVAVVAAVPVVVGCAAIVALCDRLAADLAMARRGPAADHLDRFIESVQRCQHRTSGTSQRD